VVDASLTVTFWPAEVDSVKLDADMLATVPTAPPAAGPDLVLDPPPPEPEPPGPEPPPKLWLLLAVVVEAPPDVAATIP
jgi:hypothetical protein